jgi:hypothetical protein
MNIIPTKNQKFPQKKSSSSIPLGSNSINETAIIAPPENPNPTARNLREGDLLIKAMNAPIVVDNPAKVVSMIATNTCSNVTMVSHT